MFCCWIVYLMSSERGGPYFNIRDIDNWRHLLTWLQGLCQYTNFVKMSNYSFIYKWKTCTPTNKLPGPKCNHLIIKRHFVTRTNTKAEFHTRLLHISDNHLNVPRKNQQTHIDSNLQILVFERRSRAREVHTCSDAEVLIFHEFWRTSTRPTTRSRRRALHRRKHDSSPAAVIRV